jgi:RimJ/RimL family protein N-acetyltransferase
MSLSEKRAAIRGLLDERNPADALAAYYAHYYADHKTQLVTYPPEAGPGQAAGFVSLSRTGIDLFRPFVTLRLPQDDMAASVELMYQAMPPGAPVILNSPAADASLLRALFDVQAEEHLQLFLLDRARFEPVINVLVTEGESHNEFPRFVIHHNEAEGSRVVASAGLNWQTRYFADIIINVDARYRRRGWGRSVLAATVQYLIANGRTPLYVAAEGNEASIQLAQRVGFVDSGIREVLMQGALRARP